MNRIFGNNKLLLRKSEFLGMFLVSITKLKVKFLFTYSSTPCCLNIFSLASAIVAGGVGGMNQDFSPQVFPGLSYRQNLKLRSSHRLTHKRASLGAGEHLLRESSAEPQEFHFNRAGRGSGGL